jgi:DNA invertase Pin-like site-specific DNA recombinase
MQRTAIEEASEENGDDISAWYTEKQSKRTLHRPALEQMRADVQAGKLRKLYVLRFDRLTRSGVRDTLQVIEELKSHGCEIVSIEDGFDLNGPAAKTILAVMTWASKVERQAINERIAAARERLEAEGQRWGRPRRMGTAAVRKAKKLRDQGHSIREIAAKLDVPKSTIARALQDEP